MKEYLLPFLAYLGIIPLVSLFFDKQIAYTIHVLVAIILLSIFWKNYKLKFRFDIIAVITGIIIFFIWIGIETIYPHLFSIEYIPSNSFFLISKLFGFILIAPLIEELFTRSFLIRILISKNWRKVPIGKYTLSSFIITVLFFGFSHNRWLQGIIAGILLNLLLYKQKRIESCIIAHLIANLSLAVYIIYTNSWFLW
jgi:CAAX prenyl protease-like protein